MQEGPEQNVRIFTDRAIYRPGQTVYVNLMAWTMMGTETKATADRPVTLTLRDANGRDVAEKSLTTDAFGTAATEFHLPSTGLTGHFTIVSSLGYEREAIRVEEYKRPTFEVTFDPYQDRYAPGDTIVIKGTARTYSGVGIDGAKVSYTVVRRPSMWWRWFERDFSEATILEAQATTDADGLFEVRLPLTIPEGATGFYRLSCKPMSPTLLEKAIVAPSPSRWATRMRSFPPTCQKSCLSIPTIRLSPFSIAMPRARKWRPPSATAFCNE